MPDLAFGTSAYSRTRGNLPDLPLVNLFPEKAPVAEQGVVLQGRPGLVENDDIGSGPIRGIFRSDGVLGGAKFVVSGVKLYKNGTEHGTITGTGPVSFAASQTELLVNAGANIHRTDGATFSTVTFPDSANVSKVLFLAGYFIALRAGTHQYYFSEVLNGNSWPALNFISAENKADPLLDGLVVNDALVLFGSESIEFHAATGDPDAPFSPIEARTFEKGVVATGCAVNFDNTGAWIGAAEPVMPGVPPSLRIYVISNIPEGISGPGIEEKLAESESWLLWTFTFEGHEFLVVRLDAGSWLYDAQTRQWSEFASYDRSNWRARCSCGGLFGDDEDGTLWTLGPGYTDAGGVLEARFRAGAPLQRPLVVNNLRLVFNVGQPGYLTGDYTDPTIEVRSSRDVGNTWSDWRQTSAGEQGNYRTRVEWRRMGMFDDPGMIFEFRITDPVPRRFSSVKANEPGGGRAR